MPRLVVSPEARADIDEILDWLEHEAGKPVALRYAERFRAAFRHLGYSRGREQGGRGFTAKRASGSCRRA
jgi:plasmid stabilization system protein ParE